VLPATVVPLPTAGVPADALVPPVVLVPATVVPLPAAGVPADALVPPVVLAPATVVATAGIAALPVDAVPAVVVPATVLPATVVPAPVVVPAEEDVPGGQLPMTVEDTVTWPFAPVPVPVNVFVPQALTVTADTNLP
jgi:hypothetical protein